MFKIFKKRNKGGQIYKFVYDKRDTARWEAKTCTLLVVAKNEVDAVNRFYELAHNNVSNVSEFTLVNINARDGEVHGK